MNARNWIASAVALAGVLTLALASAPAFAAKPKVNEVCLADFHKLCPSEELGRGKVIRCARAHIDAVTPDCKSAVDAANASNAAKREAKASKRAAAKSTASAS
jgi:hypothetical protein